MEKKANIVLLLANPNDETTNGIFLKDRNWYHLYVTTDDKIKEGNWFIRKGKLYNEIKNSLTPSVSIKIRLHDDDETAELFGHKDVFVEVPKSSCKKIIATTDSSLWEHDDAVPYPKTKSLPQPPQSFIQEYVDEYNKGNKIEDVMVEYEMKSYPIDNYSVAEDGEYTLKVSKDNTVTIKRVKDSWSKRELPIDEMKNLIGYIDTPIGRRKYPSEVIDEIRQLSKWIKDNL